MNGPALFTAGGWILFHRSWFDAPELKREPFTELQAYLWSICKGAHTKRDEVFNGRLVPIERGHFVTSIREMAAAFRWSNKRVQGFTKRMGKSGRWTVGRAGRGPTAPTLIGIPDYNRTQARDRGGTARTRRGHSEDTAIYKERIRKNPASATRGVLVASHSPSPHSVDQVKETYVTPEEASAILAQVGLKSLSRPGSSSRSKL